MSLSRRLIRYISYTEVVLIEGRFSEVSTYRLTLYGNPFLLPSLLPFPFPASLTEQELFLQELAADSDHLISSLVQCLATPPDPCSDLILDSDLEAFEQLCAAIFLLLGSVAANKEEIRYKVISERHMMKSLAKALASEDKQVSEAAARFVASLTWRGGGGIELAWKGVHCQCCLASSVGRASDS